MSHEKEEYEKCSICIGLMTEEDEDFILTLKCNHSYHTKCIAQWIIDHGTCPLCRKHDNNVRNPLITFNVIGYDNILTNYKTPIESFTAYFAIINTFMTILLGLFTVYVSILIAFFIDYFYFPFLHHDTNTTYNWYETTHRNLMILEVLIFSMNIFTYIMFLGTHSNKIIHLCMDLLVPVQFAVQLNQQICRIERLFVVNVMASFFTCLMILWIDKYSWIICPFFIILNSVMVVSFIDLIMFSWMKRLTFYPNIVYERILPY
jgi:hypothetical protein